MDGFLNEIVRNAISVFFGLVQTGVVALFGVVLKLYIDNRSLKKAMNAAFEKIRKLENKLEEK